MLVFVIMMFFLTTGFSSIVAGYSIQKKSVESLDKQATHDTLILTSDGYNKPNSYAELVSWYQSLETLYPDYLEVFKANELYNTGEVDGGYDLYYVRITNEATGFHKPEVLFLGSPHGDETVGTICLYWFTDWLMRKTNTDEPCYDCSKEWLRWLLDNREIYIEVAHNPYGFDENMRFDKNYWDLNREADYDGPGGYNDEIIWGSVNGRTLRAFIDHHLIRVGCDFHGGVRMLIYPWSSNHDDVYGDSPITGKRYRYAPPDFYYIDSSSLRLGEYMGDYGGDLNKNNIGPIPAIIGYKAKGGICPWAYGADVEKNPAEDPYVNDEQFGNYPGSGILWISPEMSEVKDPSSNTLGSDTVDRFGAEVRRFVLHQTDLAQPYVRWQSGAPETDVRLAQGAEITFNWEVNGCMVADHTSMQWGTNPDPITNPQHETSDHDTYNGMYIGGTGWDNAKDGEIDGITYTEKLTINDIGDYYFVGKAQVDQIYKNVLASETYGTKSYLRIIKERTNGDYYEKLEGTDGTEEIHGQLWWYSPIIHITICEPSTPPMKPTMPSGPTSGKPEMEYTYTSSTTDPDGDQLYYLWDWDDETTGRWLGPYKSGETCEESHIWREQGIYQVRVKSRDFNGTESEWSDPLPVSTPKSKVINRPFLQFLEHLTNKFPLLARLLQLPVFEKLTNLR